MIIAYHAIFTTYGTWLPNDPRGSHSREIYKAELAAISDIKHGRQSPQPSRETMHRFRIETVPLLDRDSVYFNAEQRQIVGGSFTPVVERLQLIVHACAVMSNHVHILIRRGRHTIEYLVNQLKGAATHALGLQQTPWTRGTGWKVLIDDEAALPHVLRYIEANPRHAGLPEQDWDFLFPLERYYRSLELADAEAARRRADER